MSGSLSAINLAEVNKSHLYEVILVKLDFDVPVYAHSGIGTITFETNDYLGVGTFGQISNATETENLRPTSLNLVLSGIDPLLVSEALDSGRYGDVVTVYCGYRQDDGTLIDNPWILGRGKYELGSISHGDTASISITVQHDLAVLNEKDGSRYSDEDQQARFPGDLGFAFIADMNNLKLSWGGGTVVGGGSGGGIAGRGRTRGPGKRADGDSG